MTPEQRRIAALERRIRLLRSDLVLGLVLGAAVLPAWLARLDIFQGSPTFALQAGIVIGLIFVLATTGLREFFANRREAALRKQALLESIRSSDPKK